MSKCFINFESPQEAYKYAYKQEANFVIEGEKSALVFGDRGEELIKKTKKGWTFPKAVISMTVCSKNVGSVSIQVTQYKALNEYYISILDMAGGTVEISDNQGTKFERLDMGDGHYSYWGYLKKLDEEYRIMLNGIEVILVED